jgi:hypothetical protein
MTLRRGDQFPSLPSIQSQSPWGRDGEPTCPRCHWSLDPGWQAPLDDMPRLRAVAEARGWRLVEHEPARST